MRSSAGTTPTGTICRTGRCSATAFRPISARPHTGPEFKALPFTSVYLLDDEWAAEIANKTVHGVMHISWVEDGNGCYRGQMAVYVKPNGLLGNAYMAAIKPFRHRVVYPAMLRQLERRWQAESEELSAAPG
ncbi:MAG TPA: DUF2867 domain-containing protein [Solirubrobacterales bacterium]